MQIKVDLNQKLGKYTDPTAWQNSTLRYSPPGDFPAFLQKQLGTPEVMRVFITLDEYWDYRTDTYYPDYAIGVKRYPDSELHYIYDWRSAVPAPSGVRFREYLCTHAACAKDLLLNVRRLEREVSDGIITYEQYETVFEKAVEYCKELAPNIRYIECCNEVDIKSFGNLTAEEYYKIYLCAYRAIKRLNRKHNYEVPLLIGGWSVAKPFIRRDRWERFLELLAGAQLEEDPIDFYSVHYYHQACSEGMVRLGIDEEAQALGAVDRFKLLLRRHHKKLAELGLPEKTIFCNEMGRTRTTGVLTDSLRNAAGVFSYLIAFEDPELNSFYMFPWCSFHNPELQISYTQFLLKGKGEYAATPNGIALMMLHKIKGERVKTEVEDCATKDAPYCAIAVMQEGEKPCLYVVCTNPIDVSGNFSVDIRGLADGKYEVREYLCNSDKNNCVTGTGSGKMECTDVRTVAAEGGLRLETPAEINAFVLYEITPKQA